MKGVQLSNIISEFNLEILRKTDGYETRMVTTEELIRPGLPLHGFFEHFNPERLQIIGRVETAYLAGMASEERLERLDHYFAFDMPAVIISRGMDPLPELMMMAEKHDRTVLRSQLATAELIRSMISYLAYELAPRITRHGVLLEVYGEGVLLLGESGVGKSETAIELVKRGHRLIADDAVEIKRISAHTLVGTAPPLIRHYIELRGIGVVDVQRLFGMSAIKDEQEIDMVISLEQWKDGAMYDRLGLDDLRTNILDVELPMMTIPVRPGRNLAVIIEVAAMNNRQKKMGYNSAQEFTRQINEHFERVLAEEKKTSDPEES